MTDLLLLSNTATNEIDKENSIPARTNNPSVSPTAQGLTFTPRQSSLAVDSVPHQAVGITPPGNTPGTPQAGNHMDLPREWYMGGQSGRAGTTTNTTQDEANPLNPHQKPKSIKIPTLASDGGVTKACLELGTGGNLVQAAETFTQLYEAWFSEESGMGQLDRISRISDQPAPFPLLMVNASDNTINVIHGVKKFVAPFGMQRTKGFPGWGRIHNLLSPQSHPPPWIATPP